MAMTRIETADLGLPAIDALEVDALAIFVGPERPLQGLAGFADWRLCGLISRAIRDGCYGPDTGEALLPAAPRKLVLLGDARALHRELAAARDALAARDLELVAPVLRVEMPSRSAGLPHHGTVQR